MSSIKTQIIDKLVISLKRINGGIDTTIGAPESPYTFNFNVADNVYRRFKYMDEINDFPSICLYATRDRRSHIGAAIKYGTFVTTIRGYVKSGESSIDDSDNLANDIEYAVESFNLEGCSINLVDARILSIETDEGLMSPYGLCEISVEIAYQYA